MNRFGWWRHCLQHQTTSWNFSILDQRDSPPPTVSNAVFTFKRGILFCHVPPHDLWPQSFHTSVQNLLCQPAPVSNSFCCPEKPPALLLTWSFVWTTRSDLEARRTPLPTELELDASFIVFLNINYLKPQPAAVGAQCRAKKVKVEAWLHTNFPASYCFPSVPLCLSGAGVTESAPSAVSLAPMMANPAMHLEDHFAHGPLSWSPPATTQAACRPILKIAQPKFNFIPTSSVIVNNYWELISTQGSNSSPWACGVIIFGPRGQYTITRWGSL